MPISDWSSTCSLPISRPAGELQLILPVTRRKQHAIDGFQEVFLCAGGHVQPVHDTVGFQVFKKPFLAYGVVVAIVQGARAAEEIHVFVIVFVNEQRATGVLEAYRERSNELGRASGRER